MTSLNVRHARKYRGVTVPKADTLLFHSVHFLSISILLYSLVLIIRMRGRMLLGKR